MVRPVLREQLPHTLRETDFSALGTRYRGKVRDTYAREDRLVLITTDRLSAFDRVLTTIPFKGEILNRLTNWWFERTKHIVANHLLEQPDPNVAVARRCTPFPIEVVVRGYLTGSLWRDYQSGTHTAYDVPFPKGMRKDQRFERPIVTPATKETGGAHDQPISEKEILARGMVSERDWRRAREAALGLFEEGQKQAAARGLILVDTKYEFGTQGGEVYLIDEMHTPDCSRYWIASEYAARFRSGDDQQMLDKENIRQWLIKERNWSGHGEPPEIPDTVRVDLAEKYATAYERITGEPLVLKAGDALQRIRKNLAARGYL
ncbi:MAG TPA: phosphoribosylaminoimidazolesuccinocarboxamide synthase [Myxococcaceae bacterium]|nr:phosphoribosylaminoimidazolesuccinocarboxamide synthase [Myxococcaceae bacterium]